MITRLMHSKLVVIPAKAGIQEHVSIWNNGFPLSREWQTFVSLWLFSGPSRL